MLITKILQYEKLKVIKNPVVHKLSNYSVQLYCESNYLGSALFCF